MGRPKKELKRIHRRKVKKAKEKLKLYLKSGVGSLKITQLAKKLFKKRKKEAPKAA